MPTEFHRHTFAASGVQPAKLQVTGQEHLAVWETRLQACGLTLTCKRQ